MAKLKLSTKRLAISKANAQILAITSAAAFVTVFSLVAGHALLAQRSYQNKVITAKENVNNQLKKDVTSVSNLVNSYQSFNNQPTNVIGGASTGTADNDGKNTTIVLDALPSKYDFPALTSSLEKILRSRNLNISSISGTDDEVAQQATVGGAVPQPIAMPFSFAISNANYSSVQELIDTLELSIRPIQIDSLTLSGGADNMTLSVNAHTYYQPDTQYKLTTKAIK